MSQENVELVRAAIDEYNRGDLDAALKVMHPDFELDWSRAMGTNQGVYRADQVRRFFDDFAETFESIRIEPHEFVEVGEHVVVPQTGYIRGRDGIEATARITLLWTIHNGSVMRICLYQDKQEALEAVGLSE